MDDNQCAANVNETSQQRVTATFRRPDGRTLHVRTATQAEPDQRALYDALSVDPQPGGVRKTLV